MGPRPYLILSVRGSTWNLTSKDDPRVERVKPDFSFFITVGETEPRFPQNLFTLILKNNGLVQLVNISDLPVKQSCFSDLFGTDLKVFLNLKSS